jgi:rare lipoprotein A
VVRHLAVGLLALIASGCEHETEREYLAPPRFMPEDRFVVPRGAVVAPSAPSGLQPLPLPVGPPYQVGYATWYGKAFAGRRTSNGERFDPGAMTAAHRRLPFGTWVLVTRRDTGSSVRVRITDRGPWGDDKRVIDLSQAAGGAIGMLGMGIVEVELRVLGMP